METKSTPGFISKVNKMNENARKLEEIDLEEVDREMKEEANARRIDNFDEGVGDEPEEVRRARTTNNL